MTIVRRDFDTMVDAICDRIIAANVGFTDKNPGSVLRTLVESIALEMDAQWYQLGYVDDSVDPDVATGSDLDRLVAILGIIRNPATKVSTIARFGRSTPALSNIPIPFGSVISTKQDSNGDLIEFTTTDDNKYIPVDSSSVDVHIQSRNAGKMYIPSGGLCVISQPIIGVEWVSNISLINGGSDAESDASLRARAKLALANIGKGSNDALVGAIMDVDGVVDVNIHDMARGVGTCDISVVCSTMPPVQDTIDAINKAIADTKASGINIAVNYPTAMVIDINLSVVKDPKYDTGVIYDAIGQSILKYFGTLGIGDTMYLLKLQGQIALSHPGIVDIQMGTPSSNIVPTSTQIIRVGEIAMDGGVWVSG